MKRIILQGSVLTITALIFLTGCKDEPQTDMKNTISTQELSTNESTSIEKEVIDMKGVEDVEIIHSKDKLLVAIKVTNIDRFQIEGIEKKVKKKMDSKYPEMEVTVSPDKKIFMKIMELENQHASKKLSEREIHKKVVSLIKLSKDEG
ncbi:YhcN/YlaJ family sporulation lipoprotein [Pseudalkalibacillus sp. Hm43]|uniref:YhcN/YlaJ family sporulation lipoprotein n=1 Tax=Pseudalkalibacillus sp. Hm43 TaxID=3450742 RepID=UPI003F41C313